MDILLKAMAREKVPYTPVWFMRQAGRALKSYRTLRERYSFHELSTRTETIVEVTMLPVRELNVDAAILFADLTTPLHGMGVRFSIVEGKGPVMENPIRDESSVNELRDLNPEKDLSYLLEAIRHLKASLRVPLIGFIAAPYTLATYMVEGRGGRDHPLTRALLYRRPDLWERLMERLTANLECYGLAQIEAGVDTIQVFDSWLGGLPPLVYREYVYPHTRRLIQSLQSHVPVIYFGTKTAGLLEMMAKTDASVIGVDWRINLDDAWRRIGFHRGIQGNLDPAVLLGDRDIIRTMAKGVLDQADRRPGHIFNLGHGILPQTPEDHLKFLVEFVHEYTRRA